MIGTLEHTVERTLAIYDQLALMWGPTARLDFSVLRLSHGQIHALGGPQRGIKATKEHGPFIYTRLTTPMGWEISFHGDPELYCDGCRHLLGLPSEIAQSAGVIEHLGGSAL